MARYSLVSRNIISSKEKILISKQPLVDIDKFIFNVFTSLCELKLYYDLSEHDDVKIVYKANNSLNFLELIYKNHKNYFLASIMDAVKENNIDNRTCNYLNFIAQFIDSMSVEKLRYLFNRGYINLKIYNGLVAYINDSYSEYNDIYNFLKYHLSNYLVFRRLFIGLKHYENRKKVISNYEQKLVSTDDEFLNQLYNIYGLDAVYSVYDLDDLASIEGIEQLNIDVFSKRMGKK